MRRYIRLDTKDLPRDTARAFLKLVVRAIVADEKPILTQPKGGKGAYYAVFSHMAQCGAFTAFLEERVVPYTASNSAPIALRTGSAKTAKSGFVPPQPNRTAAGPRVVFINPGSSFTEIGKQLDDLFRGLAQ